MEPVVHQVRTHGFSEGWLVALQKMGVVEDSLLRNPEQILYPTPVPPIQSQANATNEEETLNMRELVHAIDTYVEIVDLKITNNLHAEEGQGQTLATNQPTGNALSYRVNEVTQVSPAEPSA